MRDGEQISKVKKEIISLETELKESSAQLGGVFYDSGIRLEDSTIEDEIDRLEKVIPEVKGKMDTLKSYNLSISEAEEGLGLCTQKIKELESGMGSVFEKVGVELYCFIGEKELAYSGINSIYRELKDGELKSETLENKLYAYENSAAKKSVFNIFSAPFKVRGIKKDIRLNNKESLKKFRDLGRVYTQIPQLIDEESNESLLDVLEEFIKLDNGLKGQSEKQRSLQKRIEDDEQKIKEGTNGVRLKTLYNKLEQEIVETQNQITQKLIDLGYHVANLDSPEIENIEVQKKLSHFREKEQEISRKRSEFLYLEKDLEYHTLLKEIIDREGRVKIEEEHIALRVKTLEDHKIQLSEVRGESELMAKWLKDNSL